MVQTYEMSGNYEIIPALRFKTAEDGLLFDKTNDPSLAIPPYIEVDGVVTMNPEYDSATFERVFIMPHSMRFPR